VLFANQIQYIFNYINFLNAVVLKINVINLQAKRSVPLLLDQKSLSVDTFPTISLDLPSIRSGYSNQRNPAFLKPLG